MRMPIQLDGWKAQLADDSYLVYKFGLAQGNVHCSLARASCEEVPEIRAEMLSNARFWAVHCREAYDELIAKAHSKEIEIAKKIERELLGFPPDPVLPIFIGPNGQRF